MTNKIKMITFDLDDTLWDNKPTITNAEIKTRKWIEDRVGTINWGDLNDFLQLRETLIKKDSSMIYIITKYNNPKLLKALLEKGILDSNNNNNMSVNSCSPLIYAAINRKIDFLSSSFPTNNPPSDFGLSVQTHLERFFLTSSKTIGISDFFKKSNRISA